jgi:hypothetical protein
MALVEVGQTLQNLGLFTAIRESHYAYPIVLSTHLACLALFGGTILATNLRLLGWAFTDTPAALVIARLRPWKYAGFTIMVTCGLLIAGSKASEYFANPYFGIKMLLLVFVGLHALAYRGRVYRNPSLVDGSAHAKTAATVSFALWTGLLAMGRWIAYFD